MSATADPFHSLRAEVEANLKAITSKAGGLSSRNVEDELQRIHWDLEMLEESIARVTANPTKFGITSDELNRRHQFVASVKQQMTAIRNASSRNGGETQAAQRDSLLGGKNQSGAAKRAAAELDSANEAFMEQESDRQALLVQEQDEHLDDLGNTLKRLGTMGRDISEEMTEQGRIIDDLQNATDHAVHNMNDVNKLVADMLKSKQGRNQLCLIALLVAAIMVVIFLIFVL